MGTLIGELRYALRQFWVARVFTITAVLTLALGIGGTTAIFTLIHAVMLRSLPVSDPVAPVPHRRRRQLLRPGRSAGSMGDVLVSAVRAAEGGDAGVRGGHGVSGRRRAPQRAGGRASTRRRRPLRSEYVTGNYFSTLGVSAFGGRVFTAADDMPAAPPGRSC